MNQPVPQELLMEQVLPRLRETGAVYRKITRVRARTAVPGEEIASVPSDGEETVKTAEEGEYLVENLTEAQERYLVGAQKFKDRYTFVEEVDDQWKLYDPEGEVRGLEVSRELTDMLGVGKKFLIMAPWKSEQVVRQGDMFVSPHPDLDEVYRIARKEFEETYELESSAGSAA